MNDADFYRCPLRIDAIDPHILEQQAAAIGPCVDVDDSSADRYRPDLLQKHLSSFGLLLSFIDVAKILRHSRVPWSPTMRRVLSLLSISVSGYDEASPECLLYFLPDDVAYYY